jgi:hypothetical protein
MPVSHREKTFLYFLAITGFDWLQLTVFRLSSSRAQSDVEKRVASLIGWSLFTAMAALNVAMFVRNRASSQRTQGVSLHGSLGPPHEMGSSGGC